jgi:uncharacterized BrkB/YihY/UPF0761 family membrane protein
VPLVLLAGAVLGFVFAGDPSAASRWLSRVAEVIPGLEQVTGQSFDALVQGRVQAGIIGVAALAWTGSSLAGRAAHTLARVFELPERPWYRKRLWALAELAVVGAASLVGIGLTALTSTGGGPLPWIGAAVLDLVVALLAYRILTPPGGPSLRAHLPGALLLAGGWTALKLAGGWYVEVVVARATAIYGTIAAIVGLLAIFSLAANAFVYGAELTAALRDDEA